MYVALIKIQSVTLRQLQYMKNGSVKIQDAEIAKYNKRLLSTWE